MEINGAILGGLGFGRIGRVLVLTGQEAEWTVFLNALWPNRASKGEKVSFGVLVPS